jgi:recombination protein RecA
MAKNDMVASLESINKILGKSTLSIYSKRKVDISGVIPFGLTAVDAASSIGGIPRGKLIEIFGRPSSGKSWLTLKLIASAQAMKLRAGLLDAEHAFMPDWAANQGVNLDALLYGDEFSCGEDCLDQARAIVQSGKIDLLVIDSTAALIPKSELEGSLQDQSMGVHARMMSKAVKQIMDYGAKSNCTTIFVNQIRNKIGVMFGNPETTPGGEALKFYSDVRISVKRLAILDGKKASDDKLGIRSEAKFEKNRVGNPETTPGGEALKFYSDVRISVKRLAILDGKKASDDKLGIRSEAKFEKNRVGKPFGKAEFEIYFEAKDNTPLVRLVDMAYRKPLGLLKRKKGEDGETHYIWTIGDEDEDTGCASTSAMAEWLTVNGYVIPLLDKVEEKAKKDKVEVPADIIALRQFLSQPQEVSAETAETSESK